MSTPPRTLVLTGATRGMGRALALELAAAGHVVHGCGTSRSAVAELAAALPAPCSASVVDVSDAAAVSAWAARVLAAGPAPDLLINNAAVINALAPVWKVPAAEWSRLLAVNVAGTAHVIAAFVPAMIAAGRGVIVNLSSGWGRSTSPEVGPYCASKYAVEGLSGSLAQELPLGLACVALSPGVVDTDMLRSCLPDTAAVTDGPEAWARRNASFLLELGSQHNGQSLSVS